jgi:hypothetical protein
MVSPQAKRAAVTVLMTERDFGVTRACGLVGISRSLYRYRSRRPDSARLCARIEEIAAVKRRYGYCRVYLRLRREGCEVNRKRVDLSLEFRANHSWEMARLGWSTYSRQTLSRFMSRRLISARSFWNQP